MSPFEQSIRLPKNEEAPNLAPEKSSQEVQQEYEELMLEVRSLEDKAMNTWLPWKKRRMRAELDSMYDRLIALQKGMLEQKNTVSTDDEIVTLSDDDFTSIEAEGSTDTREIIVNHLQTLNTEDKALDILQPFNLAELEQARDNIELHIVATLDEQENLDKVLASETTEKELTVEELLTQVIQQPEQFGLGVVDFQTTENGQRRLLNVRDPRERHQMMQFLRRVYKEYATGLASDTKDQRVRLYARNIQSEGGTRNLQDGEVKFGLKKIFQKALEFNSAYQKPKNIDELIMASRGYQEYDRDFLNRSITRYGKNIVRYNTYLQNLENVFAKYQSAKSEDVNSPRLTTELTGTEIKQLQEQQMKAKRRLSSLRRQRYLLETVISTKQRSEVVAGNIIDTATQLQQAGQALFLEGDQMQQRSQAIEKIATLRLVGSNDFVEIGTQELELATESLPELGIQNVVSFDELPTEERAA